MLSRRHINTWIYFFSANGVWSAWLSLLRRLLGFFKFYSRTIVCFNMKILSSTQIKSVTSPPWAQTTCWSSCSYAEMTWKYSTLTTDLCCKIKLFMFQDYKSSHFQNVAAKFSSTSKPISLGNNVLPRLSFLPCLDLRYTQWGQWEPSQQPSQIKPEIFPCGDLFGSFTCVTEA